MSNRLLAKTLALAAALSAGLAFAGDDMTSLSYISYLERYATIIPAHGEEAVDAIINLPVITGDRLDTARGARVEVQLADGCTLWVDEFATVDFDAIAGSQDDPASRTAVYLVEGTAAIEVPSTALGEGGVRFDSPVGFVVLGRPGLYRLDWRSGQLRVQAHAGLVELPVGMASALMRTGQEAWLDASQGVEKAELSLTVDDFWSWVQERRQPAAGGETARHVDSRAGSRAAVLDYYGEWVYVDTFSSWMWRPHVSATWVPYSHGRWYWSPVGWNWVSYYPWGWYPFHYGSWNFSIGFGWTWGYHSHWSPAWVHWVHAPGYVGWCPRGYYDWWYAKNCTNCWGQGTHAPHRWRDVAFDFSGRVRLRNVDPRPWNVVSSRDFASSRLDRVRVAPERLLRQGDGVGIVRSGRLVTERPSRLGVERTLETVMRETPRRDGGDLGTILRREPGGRAIPTDLASRVRTVRTADVVTPVTRTETRSSPTTVRLRPSRDSDAWQVDSSTAREPRRSVGSRSVPDRGTSGTQSSTSGDRGTSTVRQRVRSEPSSRTTEPRSQTTRSQPTRSQPSRSEPSRSEPSEPQTKSTPRSRVQRESSPPARQSTPPPEVTTTPRVRQSPTRSNSGGARSSSSDRRSPSSSVSETITRRLELVEGQSQQTFGWDERRRSRAPTKSLSSSTASSRSFPRSRSTRQVIPTRPNRSTPRTALRSAPSTRAPSSSYRYPSSRSTAPRAATPRSSSPRSIAPRTRSPRSSTPRAMSPRSSAPRASAPRSSAPRASAPRSSGSRSATPSRSSPRSSSSSSGRRR